MRTAALVGLSLALSSSVFADEPATSSPPPVEEKTEVEGTFPQDLTGRWFMILQIKLTTGIINPDARLFEIRRGPEHLEFVLRRTLAPDAIREKLRKAAVANQPWSPMNEDLREVAEQWEQLEPVEIQPESVESKIIGADAFPGEFKVDQTTKGSKFAITLREAFSGQRIQSSYSVFGVRDHSEGRLVGTFLTTTIGVAPFPVPVSLKGDFQAYRVARVAEAPAPPARSGWRRILDLFSGCGRS